ncbi:MAG: pilin [Moraxellaceae bacterium]|nr:MAG: pilin [Moraxellaceae bacterium]
MKNLQAGFTLIELMIVVAIIGILAAIAIPQYQNYVTKSQVTRVMQEAAAIKSAVETCLLEGKLNVGPLASDCNPSATASNLLVAPPAGSFGIATATSNVPGVVMNANGSATIISNFGNGVSGVLAGLSLTWSRDLNGTWSCATTVNPIYKPRGC